MARKYGGHIAEFVLASILLANQWNWLFAVLMDIPCRRRLRDGWQFVTISAGGWERPHLSYCGGFRRRQCRQISNSEGGGEGQLRCEYPHIILCFFPQCRRHRNCDGHFGI